MNVADQLRQMGIGVDQDRPVAALEHVASSAKAAIEVVGVTRSDPLHHPA